MRAGTPESAGVCAMAASSRRAVCLACASDCRGRV
jgi:hypothetical protein